MNPDEFLRYIKDSKTITTNIEEHEIMISNDISKLLYTIFSARKP